MDNELIERLAREAGFPEGDWVGDVRPPDAMAAAEEFGGCPIGVRLARFAALVAEECAKLADKRANAFLAAWDIRTKFTEPK